MLYLIATPIGNLSDFTFRAVQVCKSCDYLLCEDTRRSSILLSHYEIQKPLKSFHQFNESKSLKSVLSDLKTGCSIGLLSDGGTPLICDPGFNLVNSCIQEGVEVTSIPGVSAYTQALVLSGLNSTTFQFLGFMPRKPGEIISLMPFVFFYPGTTIFYETPQRILDTLKILTNLSPDRKIVVARELTKKFEEISRKTAKESFEYFSRNPPKGEIVLLIDGNDEIHEDPSIFTQMLVEKYKISLTDAIKVAAHLLKIPKQFIYKQFHQDEK